MSTAKTSKKLWERQLKEPGLAYQAFNVWKDLGVERTVPKTARALGKSESHCYLMHNTWKWAERASAWDDEVQKQKNNATLKALQQMAERHAKIAMVYQAPFATMAKVAQDMMTLKEEELKAMDIDKFLSLFINFAKNLDTITGVERKARGEATEIVKTDITSNGNPIRVILPSVHEEPEDADDDYEDDEGWDDSEDLEADGSI